MELTRVLVTGSDGLIGRWVSAELLKCGYAVIGLDLDNETASEGAYTKYICDILDHDAMARIFQEERPDAVIHLAARTDLEETKNLAGYDANMSGVRNVCEVARQTDSVRRVIYTSSQLVCKVGYVPINDTDYCPNTLYGESKVWTEKIVREEDGGGVEWCLTRPTTVWGPFMKPHYQSVLRYILQGRYFHAGESKLFKSYSYAGNIAYQIRQLLLAPAEQIHRQTFFLADYEPLSLRAYTNLLQDKLGAKPIPTYPLPLVKLLAKTGDILNLIGWKQFPFNSFRLNNILTEYVIDMNPTEAVCGPLPYTFAEGVQETVDWYLALNENK